MDTRSPKNGSKYTDWMATCHDKRCESLSGAPVHATDIRTGASLIIAALQADGLSTITGIDHINRGYEDIVTSLSSLGSTIEYNDDDG